jgi:flavin reductase (DIM6/NTAB) family NADH-FMN oxidoreductase RutF
MIIDNTVLANYDSRYRAVFMNSLAGIKPAFLIGTKSKDGFSNLAIFNSLIHLGANPPLWGFICRPDTVKRDTLSNILETHQFTVNYVATPYFDKAHQTSAKYDRPVSEFDACGFTELYHADFDAPFVAEAHVKVGLKFQQKMDISINNTMLIIGSIEFIEIADDLISSDGFVAFDKSNTLACVGLDAYYETRLMERLSYATADTWPEKIG